VDGAGAGWRVHIRRSVGDRAARTRDAGRPTDILGKGALAEPQGMVQQGKSAIVAQQCALACGAKPGIDSTPCTHRCIAECASASDLVAIDACASKTAESSPQL